MIKACCSASVGGSLIPLGYDSSIRQNRRPIAAFLSASIHFSNANFQTYKLNFFCLSFVTNLLVNQPMIPFLEINDFFSIGDVIAVTSLIVAFVTWLIYYRTRFGHRELRELEKRFQDHMAEEKEIIQSIIERQNSTDVVLAEIQNDIKWIRNALEKSHR